MKEDLAVLPEKNGRTPVIYTIGSGRTTAQKFFERLNQNGIQVVLDVRLKNTSHIAGFSKSPDIRYFVKNLTGAEYMYDGLLAPSAELLEDYKKNRIDWTEYEVRFAALMKERKADAHILHRYADISERKYCLLCSEASPKSCHRRLVAQRMAEWFGAEVIHL